MEMHVSCTTPPLPNGDEMQGGDSPAATHRGPLAAVRGRRLVLAVCDGLGTAMHHTWASTVAHQQHPGDHLANRARG